jgi:hypothetical protein
MKRSIRTVLTIVALGGPLGARAWAETVPWLHVRVEEPRREAKVSVNLPLSVVEAALKAAPEKIVSDGKIHLGGRSGRRHDLSLSDLRRLWTELRATGDAELVSVEEKDETVRIARAGSLVQIRVAKAGGQEEVHVDLPVTLVDALLSGEGESVDLKAALAEVRKLRGDIVRVKDDDSHVRVWIDEGN